MNKQIEALKMAIAEIEGWIDHAYGHSPEDCADNKAIQACKKALAEAEKQEPEKQKVKVLYEENGIQTCEILPTAIWQSLSDDEIDAIVVKSDSLLAKDIARAIEQALKEKNHERN